MPDAHEPITEAESVLLNALERSVQVSAEHAVAVILAPNQMDVLCTEKLCHHQLSALFLALSQRHADFAAEQEKDNVEIVH